VERILGDVDATGRGAVIWRPGREWIESTNIHRFMRKLGFSRLDEFLRFSTADLERFWDLMVKEAGIEWFQPYASVLDCSAGPEWARWFNGGRLNIAHNCLDRHAGKGRVACIQESEDGSARAVTFEELLSDTNRLANGLRSLGLREGDRVALVMPMAPEILSALYACFKLGLVVVPIFAGFGAGAIAARLRDSGARALFTADFLERRGRRQPLKEKVDEAAGSVERVIVLSYRGGAVPWNAQRDVWWHELAAGQPDECATLPLDSEARAMILYTSGTTGNPKGAVHTHAGALAQTSKEIWLAFDHKPDDRFFWLSDIGWMMGPWSIIGNHNFGGTVVLYDGAPDFPDPDRLWRVVEKHGVTTLGVSPTAIRMLTRRGSDPRAHNLSSLRLLGSTGEPWDETSYRWFFEKAGSGRCPILNISGGTEIIGCFLMPQPIQPLKACTLGGPAPGMAVEVFDDSGRPVRGKTGYLVCTKPAPSMTRGVWGDPKRYIESYWSRFPGAWFHGDWASVDEDGYWFLHGRADESMNVAGRKVGPAEIEQALIAHAAVCEAAVIGVPDELTGEAIVALVVLKDAVPPDELSAHLVRTLGPTFKPREIRVVAELPKTQSGKVVRRLIRQKYLGEPLADVSTVENPRALEW
jgi:acetyl-CoA synthetase